MEKVNWGVLGTANIAAHCTIPGMQKAKNCSLYAIAGRYEEKINRIMREFDFETGYVGYDKLLEDPKVQAVYIPLPNDLHKEWVIKALKAGKHVLCEKPLALNAKEAEEMYAVAKENNVILMEAYAYLHSPYMEALKQEIAAGILGDIQYIETAFLTQGYEEDFRLHKELGGGMIYDLGCYCTTMILSLIDSEPEYVKAIAEMTNEGVDAFTAAIMKFKNGVRASFNVGMILGKNSNSRFDRLYIHGTKGDIKSDVEYNEEGDLCYRVIVGGKEQKRLVSAPSNYTLEVEQLGRCILNNEKPLISPDFSLKNARLLDKLLEEVGFWK